MAPSQPTEVGPRVAGRYRVLERIGSGGMATVFLAEDELLGRRIAIKRLRPDGPGGGERRILREARLGAALNHPGLATIFDVIDDDDGTLVVMEYVEGRALSELIPPEGLEPKRVGEILRPVASALDHAHRNGVVHRDVKPANILIGDAGAVRLVDLGAAITADATRITTENQVVGTLAYIAPERLTGEDPGGPEADVYSLAVTAFEALTGAVPVAAADPAEALAGLADGGPPSLRDRWPDAPTALCLALARGMERDPARRQRSGIELVAEIDVAVSRGPLDGPGPRVATTERLVRDTPTVTTGGTARRRWLPWLAAGTVAGLAAIAVAALALTAGGGAGSATHHASSGSTNRDARQRTPPPNPTLGAQLNDQGYSLVQSGDYAAAVPILRRAVARFPEDTSDLNYGYALFNLAHALRMSGHPAAAVPLLKRRLRIPDQTATVRAELDAARAGAGVGR